MFGAQIETRPEQEKKPAKSNMVDNLRGEFDPHRHLRREASVLHYNGAGMILNQIKSKSLFSFSSQFGHKVFMAYFSYRLL
jgi:hypothetical protein